MSKLTQSVLFIILSLSISLKLGNHVKWEYIEVLWPLWMFIILLIALCVVVFILNIISCKLFCKKKILFKDLLIGFFILLFSFILNFLYILNSIFLIDFLENNKSLKYLKISLIYLLSLFIFMFLFFKLGEKYISLYLYKIIFHEEEINISFENYENNDNIEEEFERRKAYKKSKVEVDDIPNFVQKFTNTYFKVKPKKIKVNLIKRK